MFTTTPTCFPTAPKGRLREAQGPPLGLPNATRVERSDSGAHIHLYYPDPINN